MSQSSSLNAWPGHFFSDALLSNQFGTLSQALLGPGRGNALAQLVVDNPIPKASLNGLLQAGIAAIPTDGTVYTWGGAVSYAWSGNIVVTAYGPALEMSPALNMSPSAVTVGQIGPDATLPGGLELVAAAKAVFDAGMYVGALVVCAED